VPTNRPQQLDNILANLARQTYPALDAVLALHGEGFDTVKTQDAAEASGLGRLEIVTVDSSVILGEVFNRGFEAASGDFVGKMDDDDFYGPEYAADLMDAFRYTEADIVGKWAHYAYLGSLDATIFRYGDGEHSYQPVVAISTLVMRRSVLDEVRFPAMPAGSGSLFLRKAGALGARVYSADRFNYLYIREADSDRHTWSFSEYELTARSDFVCQGRNIDQVVV
jgi:GT2 family glycosyltransferase